jgi:hypothetical protein
MDISAPNHLITRQGALLTHSLLAAMAVFLLALLCLTLSNESSHFTRCGSPLPPLLPYCSATRHTNGGYRCWHAGLASWPPASRCSALAGSR